MIEETIQRILECNKEIAAKSQLEKDKHQKYRKLYGYNNQERIIKKLLMLIRLKLLQIQDIIVISPPISNRIIPK